MRSTRIAVAAFVAALIPGGALITTGCHEGPGERIGEKLDGKGDTAKDKLERDGAAEEAGKKIDKTVDDLTK